MVNQGILVYFLVIAVITSLSGLLCELVSLKQSHRVMAPENVQLGLAAIILHVFNLASSSMVLVWVVKHEPPGHGEGAKPHEIFSREFELAA